jgi:hypothetical protein
MGRPWIRSTFPWGLCTHGETLHPKYIPCGLCTHGETLDPKFIPVRPLYAWGDLGSEVQAPIHIKGPAKVSIIPWIGRWPLCGQRGKTAETWRSLECQNLWLWLTISIESNRKATGGCWGANTWAIERELWPQQRARHLQPPRPTENRRYRTNEIREELS